MTRQDMIDLAQYIRDVRDFPKKGIVFKDITPLLGNPQALAAAVEQLAKPFESAGVEIVTGIESRGFIFGSLVAQRLGASFVPIRKPGKLPAAKRSLTYQLEYGTDTLEIHADAIRRGQRVLLVDDLLATGGTMKVCCDLVEQLGGDIEGIAILIELADLAGREKLTRWPLHCVLSYD